RSRQNAHRGCHCAAGLRSGGPGSFCRSCRRIISGSRALLIQKQTTETEKEFAFGRFYCFTDLNNRFREFPARQTETNRRCQAAQPIAYASAKIYRGSFGHVACRTGHFTDRAAERDDLYKDLVIEIEIVRVPVQWQTL